MADNNRPKKILFFLNHPAHFHLFKFIIRRLREKDFDVIIYIVTKDVLEDLVKAEGWDYVNLFPKGRRSKVLPKVLSTALFMLLTQIKLFLKLLFNRVDLLIGSERTITHVGRMLFIPSLYVNEDDTISIDNYITYPFATKVIVPECCDRNRWNGKKITYNGNHELAYLRPEHFTPDEAVVRKFNPGMERYFILRLVSLTASHDIGKQGINDDFARRIIATLEEYGKVYITAERPLADEFERYRLPVAAYDIHHVMYFADLFIGDSLSMAMEASVLGTPSLRLNDFVGIISVLNEMDEDYELSYGFKTDQKEELIEKLKELLALQDIKDEWRQKRERLLNDKDDVVGFFVETIEKYANNRVIKN